MKSEQTIKTDKVVSRILILIQGIITAAMAVVVMYGIITNQF